MTKRKITAIVWRTMSAEIVFDPDDVPEMIDYPGKAELLSRSVTDWKLEDAVPEIVRIEEVD